MNNLPPSEQPTLKPGSQLRVEVHAGPLAGKGFPIKGDSIKFGRAPDNDLVLDDAQVSRYHARLYKQDNEVILEDLGSTNGTMVNGKLIEGSHILQPAETISIGSSVFGVTGFPAPSTIGMAAQNLGIEDDNQWHTYQSSTNLASEPNQNGGNWLLWSGLILLVVLILAIAGVSIFIFSTNQNVPTTNKPIVVISSPVSGSEFDVGQEVIIQATATDGDGVVSLELWEGGRKVNEALSPIAAGQSPFTAVMPWTPGVEGDYTLEVRATNVQGLQSVQTVITLHIKGDNLVTPPTATSEVIVTPTEYSGIPFGIVKTDLNVRTGPGTQYEVQGRLPSETKVDIVGQNETGTWWYIVYPLNSSGRGWVASEYAPSENASGVPIVNPPTPTPTETTLPTDTPNPNETPTLTSTPSPTTTPTSIVTVVLPTNTPTSTPTPTDIPTTTSTPIPEAQVSFSANPLTINEGACTTFSWLVSNVQAVYFEGEGVAGDANGQPVTRVECPTQTHTYRLSLIKLNNEEQVEEVKITVISKLDPPSALEVTDVFNNGFDLLWRDNSVGETGFKLYNADNNNLLATYNKENTVTGQITTLDCGKTYRLYLVAYNNVGNSEPSRAITADTLTCP